MQCVVVFPSAVQNFAAEGNIDLGKSVQILNDPDQALNTSDLTFFGDYPTCGDQHCTASSTLSEPLNTPDFPVNLSNTDADHRTVIGTEGSNAYRKIKVKSGKTLNFSNQYGEYLIASLKADPGSRINLLPGDYWIGDLELNRARIEVIGEGTARLLVQNSARIKDSLINSTAYQRDHRRHSHIDWDSAEAGNPAKLVIVASGDIELRKSVVSGLVYAGQDLSLRYGESHVFGAIAATSVSISKGARVTYDAAAVSAADFADLCINIADLDGDGIEDDIDPDRDGDGVDNDLDTYPDDPTRYQLGSVEGLRVLQQEQHVYLEWREVSDLGDVSGYNIYRQPYGEPEVLIKQVAATAS
jgi:hypothetical protein